MKTQFSLFQRLKSFRYAFKGIFFAVKTQHNLWIHISAVIGVVLAGIVLKISSGEWLLVVLAIGMVLVTELLNTAIEMVVDLVSPHFSKKAGVIKDVAAGAVLTAAITAVIIGAIVFLPKLIN